MLAESISVLAITLCMLVLFLKAGHKNYAASLIPLLIVPAGHIFTQLLLYIINHYAHGVPIAIISAFVDMALLAISCLLVYFFSCKIKYPRNKKIYLVMLSSYNVILTCAFVFQTLIPA